MRIDFNTKNIVYKSNSNKSSTNENTLLAISAGAMLTPLISFIDGDSMKKTYKNRNVVRYATGLAAIGGGIAAANILTDKYISGTKNEPQKRLSKNICVGALATSAFSLVEYWAQKSKNDFNKKYFIYAPILGALVGASTYFVNKDR